MTDFLLVAPVLVPLAGGALLIAVWGRVLLAKVVSLLVAATVAGLAFYTLFQVRDSGIMASNLGDWPAPFGIILVADLFSAATVAAASLVAMASFGIINSGPTAVAATLYLPLHAPASGRGQRRIHDR